MLVLLTIIITKCKTCTLGWCHTGPDILLPNKRGEFCDQLFFPSVWFHLEDIGNQIKLVISSDLTLLNFAAQTAGWSTESAGNKIVFIHFKNYQYEYEHNYFFIFNENL